MSFPIPVLNVHTRATFVRSNVKETEVTKKIIDAILPYFPKGCVCISGDSPETTRICKALGASLVFNEASHVHVEWASGLRLK